MIAVYPVNRDDIDDMWNILSPFIEKAQRRIDDEIGMGDILNCIKGNTATLWAIKVDDDFMGSMVTAVRKTPKCKYLEIDMLGGENMHLWVTNAAKSLKVAANVFGCDKIKANGRAGWMKYSAELGIKPRWTVYEMEIGDA